MKIIAVNIKRMRKEMKLSQEDLAKKLQVTQPMIASIESGRKNPSVAMCYDIAKIFKCPISELFEKKTKS